MATDSSFDVVSKVNMAEVVNAVNQSTKEMETRFDFKGSKSSIALDEKEGKVTLIGDDEMKLKNVIDILQTKLIKRGIALRALEYGKVEEAAGGTLRQIVTLKQGIAQEKAKAITQAIRDTKLKVKAEIRGDEVRVTGAKKDDLQAVIQMLRAKDFGIELQFINYR
ncbi:MAG TPA: YajQ family cyclic di-GMP-binding protein [Symbiobacteriaceae bacterium]|nr:YajQ family cyclic di-GMP-binding protein [Symbiobacteriaceae bacterium]